MPVLGIGSAHRARAQERGSTRGMTLVEVMLVVFIIGLVSTLVVLTMPERPTPERRAAQSLSALLYQAQDRAILTGQPIGLEVNETGYALSVWDGAEWTNILSAKNWPSGVEVEMVGMVETTRPDHWPDILLDPTGTQDAALFRFRGRYEVLEMGLMEGGDVQIEAR